MARRASKADSGSEMLALGAGLMRAILHEGMVIALENSAEIYRRDKPW